jgi:hypothetical protein
MMLSKCVSLNRLIFKKSGKIDYKLLDLQLLKSKSLIENFEVLNGREKYYLTLNMVAILLFIKSNKLSKEIVNRCIEKEFNTNIDEIKNNTLDKANFLKRYKNIYNKTFNLIMDNIK